MTTKTAAARIARTAAAATAPRLTATIEPSTRGRWRVRNSEGTIISRPCPLADAAALARYING